MIEVRPTNGTADAGGGFDPAVASPGTDFSQQNAVQFAYTDIVIGGTTTTGTSVARPFTSVDVGNCIAITAGTGFTVQIVNIRSVAAGVATFDKSLGTTASTGGTGNLGGARSGFSNGSTPIQNSGILVAGTTIWVKNEAWNEAVDFLQAGSASAPMDIRGYNTTRSDINLGSGNTNNPVNNRAAAGGDGITVTVSHTTWSHINVTAAGDAGWAITTPQIRLVNCRGYNNTGEGVELGAAPNATYDGCEFDGNGNGGITGTGSTNIFLVGNNFHDNTGSGVLLSANMTNTSVFNIFDTNSSHSLSFGGSVGLCMNNVFYLTTGANTDHYVVGGNPAVGLTVLNNIFKDAARYGVTATDASAAYENYNDFHGNGTSARNPTSGVNSWGPATLSLTSDPTFTDAPNRNFAVGTNMKAAGFPGVFPGATSTGYLDIGAVQRQEGSGGAEAATGGFN